MELIIQEEESAEIISRSFGEELNKLLAGARDISEFILAGKMMLDGFGIKLVAKRRNKSYTT